MNMAICNMRPAVVRILDSGKKRCAEPWNVRGYLQKQKQKRRIQENLVNEA